VAVPKEAVGVEGSSVYLVANERLTMEQLLYALMLESANDAATAIAVLTAGSVEDFAILMNRKATELGLADTAFENPHGLDGEGHYTTARDLARLTAYALKNETFRKIVSTYKQTIPLNGDQGTRVLLNHNRLLRSYEGCIGVKTGFTKRSGRCLVTAAEREGVTLVAVTLKAPDDWDDHKRMLDYGFGAVERVTLLDDSGYVGAVPTVGGVTDRLHFLAEGPVSVTLPRGERNIRAVYEHFRFYYAPITEGDVIGRMVWYDGDREIASTSLIAAETVEKGKKKRAFGNGSFLFSLNYVRITIWKYKTKKYGYKNTWPTAASCPAARPRRRSPPGASRLTANESSRDGRSSPVSTGWNISDGRWKSPTAVITSTSC